jgi:MSHA biogenesis protein MshJ
MSATSLNQLAPMLAMRWRRARRMFDSRLLNERRLIICAALALVWFALDSALLTPSYKRFKEASGRSTTAVLARDALQAEIDRRHRDLKLQEEEARQEILRLQDKLEQGKRLLNEQKSMLAPAREMRLLMEGLLAQNVRLQLQSMKTLPPQEVKFTPIAGLELSQALLYRQGLQIVVAGSYSDVLSWLRSIESMPRKLLWDGMDLKSNADGRVTLTLMVHTFSPDRDPLEMAP